MKILGIAGSLRRDSHNRKLLHLASNMLPQGAALVEWDGLSGLPHFNQDFESNPGEAVEAFRKAIADADAVLISTPEYNASVPGTLKNALDWASRPFPDNVLRDKPCVVIGASTSLFGAVWSQAEIRKALAASGANVLESELPIGMADSAFTADGGLVDPELETRLREILNELVLAASPSGSLSTHGA